MNSRRAGYSDNETSNLAFAPESIAWRYHQDVRGRLPADDLGANLVAHDRQVGERGPVLSALAAKDCIQYTILMRGNMSDELVEQVQDLLDTGALRPGERLNEVALADQLGVSRTPLREALNRLAGRGALASRPRRGYWAPPLSSDEVRELYPVRAALDPMALRLAGVPTRARLKELKRLNDSFKRLRKPALLVDCDNAWHRALLADCPNRLLLSLIDDMIRRTRRYELAYLADLGGSDIAATEHERIMTALERRQLARACALLQRNMETAVEPMTRWLDAKQETIVQ